MRWGPAIAGFVTQVLIGIALVFLIIWSAWAVDRGQWANSDPQTREWFLAQTNPKTGVPCCSNADGVNAEEEQCPGGAVLLHPEFKCPPGDDNVWVKFRAEVRASDGEIMFAKDVDWMIVPPDAILTSSRGVATVWWSTESQSNPKIYIRCFAKGPRS